MKEDLLYSDFNGIRITSKKFYAGQKEYALEKIKQINIERMVPRKWLGIVLFAIGVLAIAIGSFNYFGTVKFKYNQTIWLVNADLTLVGIGVLSLFLAILKMILSPDEFSVEIETIEGGHESINSGNRKYVARLAASLKRAYYRQQSHTTEDNTTISV